MKSGAARPSIHTATCLHACIRTSSVPAGRRTCSASAGTSSTAMNDLSLKKSLRQKGGGQDCNGWQGGCAQ